MRHLALLLALAACTDATTEDAAPGVAQAFHAPGDPGPHTPAVTTLRYTDTRGKDMVVEVWYPGQVADSDSPDPYDGIPITLGAYRNVPGEQSGGPYPIVGFSHGLGGIRMQSAFLTEHLASHGFVVVAPDHPGHLVSDYIAGFDEDDTQRIIMERPFDVSMAIDEVIARSSADDPLLGGLVADGDIAIIGHSFGAITTLMISGAQTDFQGLVDYCETDSGNACSYTRGIDPSTIEGWDPADPRVVAAVPISPGGWYAFGSDGSGLGSMPPTLVMGGTADTTLDYDDEIRPTWEAIGAPKYMATLAEAGHYAAYSNMCDLLSTFGDCDPSGEVEYLEAARGKATTVPLTTAFLMVHFLGDDRYQPWLDGSELDEPALTWEAEVGASD